MGLPQYKPYETLKVDIGVTVLVEPKSVLKLVKCSYNKGLKGKKNLDNPLLYNSPLNRYVNMLSRITLYRRRVTLSVATLDLLFYIYSLYVVSNTAVTVYGMAREFGKDATLGSEMANVRNKVRILVRKGLLIVVGKTVNNADLYIPSAKAIDDIENIFAV